MEIDRAKKIQLAVVLLMFGAAAAYLIVRWDSILGRIPDETVTVYKEFRKQALNPQKPISQENPIDPKHSPLVLTFGCHDGRLEVMMYEPSTGLPTRLNFVPDLMRPKYVYYEPTNAPLDDISNSCRRAIVASARAVAAGRGAAVVNAGSFDRDQRTKERDARQNLQNALTSARDSAADGTASPAYYKKFTESLEKFSANTGDINKDSAKQELARNVVRAGLDYVNRSRELENKAIDQYVSIVESMLNSEQKTKLAALGDRLLTRKTRTP